MRRLTLPVVEAGARALSMVVDSRLLVHRAGGIGFLLVAMICFGALDTTTKVVSVVAPVAMALWMRYLVQTVFTVGVLMRGRPELYRTRRPLLQGLRGLLLIVCSVITYIGLRFMPVGEFTAIGMLTPLVLTMVAAWRLHEHVSLLRWLCVIGGFAGTVVVIRPGAEMFKGAAFLPLLFVACNTAYQVLTSELAKVDKPGTLHFYTGAVGLVCTTAALPLVWQALPLWTWLLMGLMGLLGTFGHLALIVAYTKAPVAVLTPYLYVQIAFATLGGWLVFSHVPDTFSLGGIALITVCGVFGTWLTARERAARARRDARRDDEEESAAIASADAH